jgi:hypothetical protein
MKKWFALSVMVVLVVFMVTSCTLTVSGGGATVSGTITFYNMDLLSAASVTVQQGSNAYGVSVSCPGPGSGTQSGSFAISNVPAGTYTFSVTFDSSRTSYVPANSSYFVNGAGPFALVPTRSFTTWTETINGVSVLGDVTIDTYLSD